MKGIYTKYKNLSVTARATLWFTICNVLQKIISVVTVPIFTRMLSTDEYGVYSLFITWLEVITIFTSLRLSQNGYNVGLIKFENDQDYYTSTMIGLSFITTLFVFVIYMIGRGFFNTLIQLPQIFIYLLFIYCAVTPIYDFWATRCRFEYKYISLTIVTILMSLLAPVVSVFLLHNVSDASSALIVYPKVFFQVIFCLVIYVFILKKSFGFYNKKYWKYALKNNIPLVPYYLSLILLNHSDRIIIAQICGNTDAAIYSVAYSAAMLPTVVSNAMVAALTPWMFKRLKDRNYSGMWKTIKEMFLLTSFIVILLILFAPEAIAILAPKNYSSAIWIIPPVALSVIYMFIYQLFINLEFYYEKNKLISALSVGVALLNIVLNYIFIPLFGSVAAGCTTVVSYMFFTLVHYLICKKISKENNIPFEKIFKIKKIIAIFIVFTMMALLSNLLYLNNIVKYLVCGFFFVLAIVNRRRISSILKQIKNVH